MSDDKPSEKPTVELEKPPAWAISMNEKMSQGFAAVRADLSLVTNDVTIIKDRVTLVEQRTSALEDRAKSNSLRVQGESQVNLEQSAKLAETIVKYEALASTVDSIKAETGAQTAMLEKLVGQAERIMSDPRVKYVAAAAWTALVAWLASKGWVAK